jgi:ATP-dependent helicase/nuclease subunit B
MLPPLLHPLHDLTRRHPLARKQLLAPDLNWGRDALAALARHTGGWIGWEAVTLKSLATELATVALHEQGLALANDIELTALADAALADGVAAGSVRPAFAALAHGQGFRTAVHDTVLELRMAGVTPATARARSGRARDVAAVLEAYERRLDDARLADPARVFRLALSQFDAEAPFTVASVLVVAPGLVARGLPGQLLARLGASASPLPSLPAPARDLDLFRAATPLDELREVFRRILDEGRRLDEVEIVTTDRDTYGIALDQLERTVGVGATSLHGVPFARTRLGRALARWLDWLDTGLAVPPLREALEAGELALPEPIDGVEASRLLRALAPAAGRAGLEALQRRLAVSDLPRPRTGHPDDETRARRDARRSDTVHALASLLARLLAIVPPVPRREVGAPDTVVSVAALARATSAWLEVAVLHGIAEERARDRLQQRLAILAERPEAPVPFDEALASLRHVLAELRAWGSSPPDGGTPWTPAPGRVHLTDLAHAGTTGRPRAFVVGLDAERVGGSRLGDPILDDDARRALDAAALPTAATRAADREQQLALALERLPARATLSYALADDRAGRETGPAPLLLLLHRDRSGHAGDGYKELREQHLVAAAVPRTAALDRRDAWLAALQHDGIFSHGDALVRAVFGGLDAGRRAMEERAAPRLTAHDGLVPDATVDLVATDRAVSPSQLEQLATCPLRWFYARALGLEPPDEADDDPGTWLDHRMRGELLHAVFERFVRGWMARQEALGTPEASADLDRITAAVLAEYRERVPPPSEAVFTTQARDIVHAARAFLDMERGRRQGRWHAVELDVGWQAPVHLALPDGRQLRVRGRIDRIDLLPGGDAVVIDYKTGGAVAHRRDPKQGPFNGGRSLQPLLYVDGARQALGVRVARFEYRFPTEKGQASIVTYRSDELATAAGVVQRLLTLPASGRYPPTTEPRDCSFCDFREVCRVHPRPFGPVPDSPRAAWAAAHAGVVAELAVLRDLRQREGARDDE